QLAVRELCRVTLLKCFEQLLGRTTRIHVHLQLDLSPDLNERILARPPGVWHTRLPAPPIGSACCWHAGGDRRIGERGRKNRFRGDIVLDRLRRTPTACRRTTF